MLWKINNIKTDKIMKRVKVVLITLVATLFTVVASAQTVEEAGEKYNQAMAKAQGGDLNNAIKLMEEAMNLAIDLGEDGTEILAETHNWLPKLYMAKGSNDAKNKKYDDAVVALSKAEELADLWGNAQVKAGASRAISTVYMAMGIEAFNGDQFEKALESFSKGYEQDPGNITLAGYTAKSYAKTGNLNKSLEIYKGIIEIGAANSKYAAAAKEAAADATGFVLEALAEAGKEQNLEKAVALADTLAGISPNEPQSNMLVIQLANNLKKYDVVIERGAMSAEAQSSPELKSDAYFILGVAYEAKGDKAKATEAYKKVTAGKNVAAAKTAVTNLSK
ncbi:tetratricopeptide repeat domain protein [Mucinivorans hirudinis]|uniref:Tetratricopeptide repeat domain protein n=1 Tax=Mucinivorans hirudinis TaxID=1433126 RepID=A0A060R644_9BACT|nr:tetratricopeptide repeat domain protein [Mucinivorans hirudinis]